MHLKEDPSSGYFWEAFNEVENRNVKAVMMNFPSGLTWNLSDLLRSRGTRAKLENSQGKISLGATEDVNKKCDEGHREIMEL